MKKLGIIETCEFDSIINDIKNHPEFLKLKDEFDEKIIDQVLDTNQKVDVNYKDFDGKTNTETSDVTPKIKLTKVPVAPVVPADNTIAPEPIPKAGTHMTVIGMFIAMIGISVFLGLKSRKIK